VKEESTIDSMEGERRKKILKRSFCSGVSVPCGSAAASKGQAAGEGHRDWQGFRREQPGREAGQKERRKKGGAQKRTHRT